MRFVPFLRNLKIVTILLGLAVAGCGGGGHSSDPAAFRAQYVSLQNRYRPVGVELSQTLQTAQNASNSALQATLSDQAGRLAQLRSSLGALTPPAAGTADYRRYLDTLSRVVGDLRKISSDAGANDVSGAKGATSTLLTDLSSGTDQKLAFEMAVGITPRS